jgi:hypothetical protein
MRQRGDVISGGSYASTNDPRMCFGLGAAMIIHDVEVHWPSGAKERFSIPEIDRVFTLAEGQGTTFSSGRFTGPCDYSLSPLSIFRWRELPFRGMMHEQPIAA